VGAQPQGARPGEEARRRYAFFFMRADGARLKTLADLYHSGALKPVLDRTFPFEQTLEAMAYVEGGRAKAKIVVVMPASPGAT
jgi:NADPH:quinone reductase-like Zn-dependent oxidoreductase